MARKHGSILLCFCTALIMMQYLGCIICSTNEIDPKIFLHRIHKYLVNPRFKMKYWGQESMFLCLCNALIMMQYLGNIVCSTNKIDPKIFLHRIHKYLVNPSFKMKYWGQESMKACFYAFVLH